MAERSLPASPNWYCSRCSDVSSGGLLGVGAKNIIYLIDVSAPSCRVVGELVGHKGLVSGFSFCHHAGQNQLCVSSSNDGAVLIWDSETKSVTKEHPGHQSPVSAVHWSPLDKNLVVSGDEKGIVLCHWYHTGDSASFFPEPRTIVCLSCSPHTWSSVAVGYKDGMIVLIDISKKGEVMHRLRGHDDEIHSLAWSPVAGEAALSSRAEDGEVTNGLSTGDEQGCFLASGSKDQTVRIWSTAKGRGVTTLKLPYLKRRGSAVDPGVKERLWLNVHWPKRWPTQLVSSCFSGELVKWDLTKSGKQKCSLFGSSEGQNHSRIVFNMSSVQLQDERELLISTSMDRDIKCWDLSSLDCCWTLPTLGGFAYALAFSPVGTGCLALGVGDNMIRVWNTLTTQNQYDTRTFWQGIKSKVTALAWHPKREGTLAFGTDDGKVGIYEVFSNKPPQVSSSYHKKTVYTLAWGPPVPPMSFGASGKQSYSLYSCAGEGTILQHDVARLSGEASDIDKLIRDTNSIKHKLSPHTDLSWKPDGSVVAIGNEDGCIEVYQAPSLKLLCSIQQHHKIINTLRWHPENAGAAPQMHGLLASGSNNAIVYVHDLRSIIENPPESPAVLTEPFRRLSGHTAKITGMAWSPHHAAKLVTASYDGTAQVWDVLQEEGVANYRGHVGNLLCVDWSPVDADVIWSGGKDFTVQEWRVSQQEFTKPPKGKKMVEMQEKMKAKKKKKSSSKKASEAAVDGEAAPAAAAPEASDGEEEREISSASSPAPSQVTYEAQRKPLTTTTATTMKNKEKTDVNALKKRKPRSMMPVTMAMEQRPKEELLQDCVTLATIKHSQVPPAGCVPGQAEHTHLGLFADRAALYRMFEAEEESHVEAGHFESVVYLRLWSGDLGGALQLATERGELNDHLLAIAPTAGFQVWTRTVEAYVKQLCLQEQHLKAASHLLSINRLYEAVDLLRSHKLYREAIALVKARLPEDEPVLRELYSSWAAVLEKDGHFSAAAKCHVALGASFDAAKVIARKNDVPSLRTAASVARICGEAALAQSLALRCAKDLAAALDWTAAQEVLSSQEQSMLVHRLHLSATELLAAALSDVAPLTCVSSHPWAAPSAEPRRRGSLLERLTRVWEEQFGVSGADRAAALLRELKTTETPAPTGSVPLRQMLLYSSLHLTRGALSWLSGDGSDAVKELWAGLSWFRESGHFNICAKLCRTLFPDGEVTVYTNKHQNLSDQPAAGSLQAFVNYHRLYERWWSHSGEMQNGFADDKKGQVVNGGRECADSEARQLLSEPHAAAQASQRAVREGQERLSAMVLQHGKRQKDEEEEQAPVEAELSRSGEQETFLSLSAKMSEHQKQLAELPEDIKAFPYPDVLECCLVLLYLGRSSSSVTESLLQEAKDLLRKHGHSPSILKASRRFLI